MNKTVTLKTDVLPYSDKDYSLGNQSLKWKVNDYVVSAAAEKEVDDSIEGPSSNLPTTSAVMSYVESVFSGINMSKVLNLIANVEDSVAKHNYTTGDAFISGGCLYKATELIFIGDAILPDINCTKTTIVDLIKAKE